MRGDEQRAIFGVDAQTVDVDRAGIDVLDEVAQRGSGRVGVVPQDQRGYTHNESPTDQSAEQKLENAA
jgi:hypothetical protein